MFVPIRKGIRAFLATCVFDSALAESTFPAISQQECSLFFFTRPGSSGSIMTSDAPIHGGARLAIMSIDMKVNLLCISFLLRKNLAVSLLIFVPYKAYRWLNQEF